MWRSCLHKLRDIFLQDFLSICKPPRLLNKSNLGCLQYFVPGSFPDRFQTCKRTHPCRPSTKPFILFLWVSWGFTASPLEKNHTFINTHLTWDIIQLYNYHYKLPFKDFINERSLYSFSLFSCGIALFSFAWMCDNICKNLLQGITSDIKGTIRSGSDFQ